MWGVVNWRGYVARRIEEAVAATGDRERVIDLASQRLWGKKVA